MANVIRYRSEAIRVKITVKVNDVAVDLTTYSGIIFILYYKNSQVLAKYSRDVLATYDNTNFKVIDAANGRFDILVQPSVTLPAYLDEVKGEIQVQKVDTDWESNTWRKILGGIEIFKFQEAFSKSAGIA